MKNQYIAFTTIILFAVGSFVLSPPKAFGVVPAPDGFYPGFNTAEGQSALLSLTTGVANTAVGWFSLKSNAEGNFNTATGAGTLLLNTGDENTATGAGALLSNSTGQSNTANGAFALFGNTEGADNTAVGWKALFNNTTGNASTAIGSGTLFANTTGSNNVANGFQALLSNTEGSDNTATGHSALATNNTGTSNTAEGFQALYFNTTGSVNTAVGAHALLNKTTGSFNTAVGADALLNNASGSSNTVLGYQAGNGITTANNVIAIRAFGENVSNSCYIGQIFDSTSVGGSAVFVNAVGKLGTTTSSRRFKDDIKPMDKASEVILALKPVTFRYKKEIDPAGRSQFGLVAEQVAHVNPDLVVCDKEGKPYTVRYDQVNAMLLNEFLKEHHTVEEQQSKIANQQASITALKATVAQQQESVESKLVQQEKQIEALTSGLQKVSAQLAAASPSGGGVEAKNPAPQMASLSAVVRPLPDQGRNNQ